MIHHFENRLCNLKQEIDHVTFLDLILLFLILVAFLFALLKYLEQGLFVIKFLLHLFNFVFNILTVCTFVFVLVVCLIDPLNFLKWLFSALCDWTTSLSQRLIIDRALLSWIVD